MQSLHEQISFKFKFLILDLKIFKVAVFYTVWYKIPIMWYTKFERPWFRIFRRLELSRLYLNSLGLYKDFRKSGEKSHLELCRSQSLRSVNGLIKNNTSFLILPFLKSKYDFSETNVSDEYGITYHWWMYF